MYKKFFGFIREPFNITPDTELFYCSKVHEEILEIIEYQLDKRRGFIVLTGDVGTGKTSICRVLINKLPQYYTSLLLNPFLNAKEILYYICKDFGIISDKDPANEGQLFHLLTEFLINVDKKNRNALIIVDEAQNLSFEAFEMIRQISNIEYEDKKLVQILFVGQSELLDKINSNELRQLRQRISIIIELMPLSVEDTINYVNFRVQETLKYKKFIFSDSALKSIYKYTNGYPREINQIAELSLVVAYNNNHKKVTINDVEKAAKEYYKKIEPLNKRNYSKLIINFAILVIFIIPLSLYFYLNNREFFNKKNTKIVSKNLKYSTNLSNNTNSNITKEYKPEKKLNDISNKKISNIDNSSHLKENIIFLNIKKNYDNISIDNEVGNQNIYYNVFLGPLKKEDFIKKINILKEHKIDFFKKKIRGDYYIFIGFFKDYSGVNLLKEKLKKINCFEKLKIKKEIKN